jgi:carboxyl-terminal processing protease
MVGDSHYQPKPLNDSLSQGVFKLFLKEIDENKRFFTKADLDIFKTDEYQLDDYIKNQNCAFVHKYEKTLEQRISSSKRILESLREQPLDYSGRDSLHYKEERAYSYFKNDEKVKLFWNKKVRYKILQKLVENDSSLQNIKSNFKTLEQDIKSKIIDNEICLLNELERSEGTISRLIETAFLDAFLKYQDPNSAYFSASEKNLFEQSVSNSQVSFGIRTAKKKNGDIIIANIAPGSAAFKQGDFEVNDIVLSLESTNETIETYCTSNATITSFINDANTHVITFKIKKKNGKIASIKLSKTSIDIENNSIIGYLIDGVSKIGYINIPSFYTDLESVNGLGVTNDVAKQIYKLQRENIEGLILDFRFNGGGSMKEATDLSGMFIDRGPLAITKGRNEDNYTIRDPNRGTIFTKPIVVLVNQFSASASEFFAAAIQDYNSAIVVGSRTHGKATSQVILPISPNKSSNFIKLTMGQFFRVTGQSHQQIGIEPDIELPNIYDGYETQESHKSFALLNSTTDVTLKHKPKAAKDNSKLRALSKRRTDTSAAFKGIKTFNRIFVTDYVNRIGNYPLTLDYVFNDTETYNLAWKNYSKIIEQQSDTLVINNTASTAKILDYNEADKSLNAKHRDKLAKDPYIQEAYHIINDIIKL